MNLMLLPKAEVKFIQEEVEEEWFELDLDRITSHQVILEKAMLLMKVNSDHNITDSHGNIPLGNMERDNTEVFT